jgi:hypothetical protein
MWSKFQEHSEAAQKPTVEALFCNTQQTTTLDMGMGLPFNVNGERRQLPWMSAKQVHNTSSTLSALMPLGS